MVKVIGYVRVSTNEQGDSGLGLDAQEEAIYRWAMLQHGPATRKPLIYEDVVSGSSTEKRPELRAALAVLRDGTYDTLIVAKLDRLGRSLVDLATILATSRKEGWSLVALDIGLDTATPTGEAMFGMMAVWAQLERRMISQRTKDAMAQLKERGVKVGRPCSVPVHIQADCRFLRTVKGYSYAKIGVTVGLGWTTVRRICERSSASVEL